MDDGMVVISEVQGEIEEEQLRAFFAAHGIPTATRGEALRHTHGFLMDGLGRVEVLVAAHDTERARELLERVERGELAVDDDEVGLSDSGDSEPPSR